MKREAENCFLLAGMNFPVDLVGMDANAPVNGLLGCYYLLECLKTLDPFFAEIFYFRKYATVVIC